MSRKRIFALFVPLVLGMIAIDRLSKAWAADSLHIGVIQDWIAPVNLTLVHNQGAAFGIGQGSQLLFALVAVAIVIGVVLWLVISRGHTLLEVIGLSLVVAGGVGNFIDRISLGYVIDFFNFTFIDFPVFNVADICVTVGVCLFVLAMLLDMGSYDEKEGDQL